MNRKLAPGTLVVASHNLGKVREIADLLAPFHMETISAGDLGLPEPEETEASFIGNAELKARAAASASKLPALADDSGLVVPALGGDPGIYSARWAERPDGARDFAYAMQRVEAALAEQVDASRAAHFICALSLAWPDGVVKSYEGRVDGALVWPPRGTRGFGYDPVFQPLGMAETFGEIDPQAKHAMSHRADAFRQLVEDCFDQ
jgi:XTP/dITP diphosphohydrolase